MRSAFERVTRAVGVAVRTRRDVVWVSSAVTNLCANSPTVSHYVAISTDYPLIATLRLVSLRPDSSGALFRHSTVGAVAWPTAWEA